MENGFSLITLVLFLPLVGMTILFFIPENQRRNIEWTAFGTTVVTFLLSLLLWAGFDNNTADLQFVQRWEWLPTYGISYYVGIDGLSLLLVILTTFIMPLAVMSSFRAHVLEERGRVKLYYAMMLLLEWAMIGVFVIQDMFLFYVFFEISLVPMFVLIGIWGAEDRRYAAIKFFLYTVAGSIFMLLAMLYVGNEAGTFALPEVIAMIQSGQLVFPFEGGLLSIQSALFLGFLLAFAVKIPIWPLHSWLPDAHVQAPTAGSVILAGVLLKMGTYGLVRFNLPLFPEASVAWAPIIGVLAVIGILYGAWVSYAQTDVKKLVAYSSVSHLGFVVLGIFALNAQGIQGGILQMVNHGISTGGLFLLVGMLYERRHTKAIDAYGGIWKALPLFGGLSLLVTLSSMGLPGLNGFVGEFTILLGTFGSEVLGFFFALFATLGVILAAVYMLYMFQKVYMGELDKPENMNLEKLHWQEIAVMIPIVIAIILIGIQPAPFFATMDTTVNEVVAEVDPYITVQSGELSMAEMERIEPAPVAAEPTAGETQP